MMILRTGRSDQVAKIRKSGRGCSGYPEIADRWMRMDVSRKIWLLACER